MSYKPSPNQALLLWKLAIAGGEMWKAECSPKYFGEKRIRGDLTKHGFISEEMVSRSVAGKRTANALKLTLEDQGWRWLAENLRAPLARSAATADVLQVVLGLLDAHLAARNEVLSDFFAVKKFTEELNDRVLHACCELARDSESGRIHIAALTQQLETVALEELHDTLLASQGEGKLTLFPIDNPSEITDADKRCEITTALGHKRHIIYLQEQAA